jgi:MoaA/NifB/PqqE/SkfB family radical SAM enzyme
MSSASADLVYFTRKAARPEAPRPSQGARRIAVVIAAYNAERTIGACLESLAAQTVKPHEIVVVDDASRDRTADVARAFGAKTIVLERNSSAGYARAMGVRRTEAEIVAFIDSDCSAPPDWIERLTNAFRDDPELGAVGGRYRHAPPAGVVTALARAEEVYAHDVIARAPFDNNPPAGNSAVRRDVWECARSGCEGYLFRGINSGEDEFLFGELRRVAPVKFDSTLWVNHISRAGIGYFKRHVNRGRSLGARLGSGRAAETKGGIEGYGGVGLLAAALCLGVAPLLAAATLIWPEPWVLAAAIAALASGIALAAGFAAHMFADLRAAGGSPLRAFGLVAGALILLPARTACWIAGAGLALAARASRLVKRIFNVAVSIAHFWIPGRISRLFFFVTSACNARCAFCFNLDNVENWAARKKVELSLEEVQKLAKNFGRLPYINISGGEPFMRTDLPDIIEAFHRHCRTQWVTIPTNASLAQLVLDQTLEILTRCPTMFLTIQVSLDGMADSHDRSRKIQGGFAAMTQTLKALARIRPYYPNLRIQIATLYDDMNVAAMPEIVGYCRENFEFDQQFFYLIRDSGRLITESKNHLIAEYFELLRKSEAFEWRNHRRSLWHRAVRALQGITYNDMAEIRKNKTFLRPCVATRKFFTLYDDGTISPCEVLDSIKLGNVRDYGYDYYRFAEEAKVKEFHRSKIVESKCNCDWMCATPINMLYDPKTAPRIVAALIRPDKVV